MIQEAPQFTQQDVDHVNVTHSCIMHTQMGYDDTTVPIFEYITCIYACTPVEEENTGLWSTYEIFEYVS